MPPRTELLIRPSRLLAGLVFAMAVLVTAGGLLWAIALGQNSLDTPPLTGLWFGLAFWTGSCVCIVQWWRARSTVRLSVDADGVSVALRQADGRFDGLWLGQLDAGSLVWPGIMVLRLRSPASGLAAGARVRSLLLVADSTCPADRRALSLWLRWLYRKGLRQNTPQQAHDVSL